MPLALGAGFFRQAEHRKADTPVDAHHVAQHADVCSTQTGRRQFARTDTFDRNVDWLSDVVFHHVPEDLLQRTCRRDEPEQVAAIQRHRRLEAKDCIAFILPDAPANHDCFHEEVFQGFFVHSFLAFLAGADLDGLNDRLNHHFYFLLLKLIWVYFRFFSE